MEYPMEYPTEYLSLSHTAWEMGIVLQGHYI